MFFCPIQCILINALWSFILMLSKDQMLGKYQIIDRLGAGGFGTVYLAMDRLLDRKVALKVPHQQVDEARALQEPKIMAQLKHENIVELITVEEKGGTYFMVMEYVEGESLDKQIKKERSLRPQRALNIAIGVCDAIAFAHSIKVIHRDLRPANILLTLDDRPKVTDFGTSRFLEMQVDNYACTRIGSPPYMAPEHFKGQTVFQSDIWSMGITIYEMLTGTVPFYDADPVRIYQAYVTRPVVPPHLRNPSVPKAFSAIVMKALAVNLGERYISAQELQKALAWLKEASAAAEGRLPQPQAAAPKAIEVAPRSAQGAGQELCRYCYQPLPRFATACPRCGEKN
jgi:serine/threonine-protein kinase